jgi:hypothetical protein
MLPRKLLSQHKKEVCSNTIIPCTIPGCDFTCIRSLMPNHITDNQLQHIECMARMINNQSKKIDFLLWQNAQQNITYRVNSYGDTMWVVHNIKTRFLSDNSTVVQWSPAFYTSTDGYCFRLKLTYSTSHLGIFFIPIPGYNDEFLNWPFHMRVTMALMENGQWEKLILRKILDPEKSAGDKEMFVSLGRPMEDYGNGRGWKQFYPKEKIEDKIYIMVSSRSYI